MERGEVREVTGDWVGRGGTLMGHVRALALTQSKVEPRRHSASSLI